MTKLNDYLSDAVADVSADLPALVTASRREGMGLRRRRRALASLGTAAAVAVVAIGSYVAASTAGHGPAPRPEPASSWLVPPPSDGTTAAITDSGLVAALGSAVHEVSRGTFAGFEGRDDATRTGELLFTPRAGGAAGLVRVQVQWLSYYGVRRTYGCEPPLMHDCTSRRLANGDTLRTYTEQSSGSATAFREHVAEVLSPRRNLRVVVSASNAGRDGKHAVRAEPVLSPAQVRSIALRPWWSRTRLPAEYFVAGTRLPYFVDAE